MKRIIINIKRWLQIPNTTEVKKRRLSLWENTNTIAEYRKALISKIIERAEKDRLKGDIKKAIDRYEGIFKYYSVYQEVHNKVAELYIEIGDKKRAGRHLYLKEGLSEVEEECINQFKKAYGNSPTIILKKLLYKENYRIKELEKSAKIKLKSLVKEAINESGTTPNFLKGIKGYLDKIES